MTQEQTSKLIKVVPERDGHSLELHGFQTQEPISILGGAMCTQMHAVVYKLCAALDCRGTCDTAADQYADPDGALK